MTHPILKAGGWLLTVFLLCGCGSVSRQPKASSGSAAGRGPYAVAPSTREEQRAIEAHAQFAAGVIHEMNDQREEAFGSYLKAAKADISDEALILDVSQRLLQAKKFQEALDLLSLAAAQSNASGLIFGRLGLAYAQLGKTEQAIKASRTAIAKSPTLLAGYHNLFVTYLQAKKPVEALAVLDQAAKQPKTNFEFLLGLAEFYLQFGVQVPAERTNIQHKALGVLNRADALEPPVPVMRVMLADMYNLVGQSGKAAQIYTEMLKKMPDVPVAQERLRAKLADIYLRGPDRSKAAEQLEAIIRDDPTNAQAYYLLGSIAFEERKNQEAADHYRKTIILKPEFEQAYYDLATAQMNLGKIEDALATLDTARKRFSQNFVMEFLTGLAYSRQKAFSEAIKYFTSAEILAQSKEPARLNELFYFQLGATCERKGDYEQAEKYFLKSLELAPNFSEALNYYGYMLADRGVQLEKARDLIEKAVKLEPKNAAFLDSMGWVLFRLNQPVEALDYIQRAIQLNEEPDPTLYDHLGDILTALHRTSEAHDAWKKSLEIENNEQVRKKLEPAPQKSSASVPTTE